MRTARLQSLFTAELLCALDRPRRSIDRPLMPEEGEAPSSGTSIPRKAGRANHRSELGRRSLHR